MHNRFISTLTICLAVLVPFVGQTKDYALTGTEVAQSIGLQPIYQITDKRIVLIEVNDQIRQQISAHMHSHGRCAGYEMVSLSNFRSPSAPYRLEEQKQVEGLFKHLTATTKNAAAQAGEMPKFSQSTADLLKTVSAERLQEDVTWISAYKTRHHQSQNKNEHVEFLKQKLTSMAGGLSYVKIDTIDHRRTQQKSLRATFTGSTLPSEIVAVGAHFDSINQGFLSGPNSVAPGADDDGSGSANLIEIFRLLVDGKIRPQRTVQFFWYAAEEVGLYGSAEIAASYKERKENVIGVMQLDMTMFPGMGRSRISIVTDFTNPWLNSYTKELNRLYSLATIVEEECGYACSDHASWTRQGFASTSPAEAVMEQMNKKLHTPEDVIDSQTDFEHSALFSKLGLAFVLSLGNPQTR